jgi:peptidoglycan/LPS O-acetylase OafA/YrhL
LISIDMLRGIAVLLVLFSHLPFSMQAAAHDHGVVRANISVFSDWSVHALKFGRFGVHLFLVISGFCIHMQWARYRTVDRKIEFLGFWKRRLRRLYPPYAMAVLLSLAGLFLLFGVVGHARGGLATRFGYPNVSLLAVDLLLLLLLLQNVNDASTRIGNGPFWTLALEEQLYVLYFPLLWMRRRLGWLRTLGIIAGATLGWRVLGEALAHAGHLPGFWYVVGPARWLEWALGAVAVEAHVGLIRLPRWSHSAFVGVALLGVAIAVNLPMVGEAGWIGVKVVNDVSFGLTFFVLINMACRAEKTGDLQRIPWITPALASVGVWSYSLYLTHEPVIVAVKQAAVRLGLGVPSIVLLRIGVPLIVAYVFHLVIERRFMNVSRARAKVVPKPSETQPRIAV